MVFSLPSSYIFDFFIDWTNNTVSNEIWLKGILSENITKKNLEQNIVSAIQNLWGIDFIKNMYNFINTIDCKFFLLLYYDKANWDDENSNLFKVNINKKDNERFSFNISKITIDCLKNDIQRLSGGPQEIGSKGLIFGTSTLECYLSHTKSLYPGDADMVLTNINNEPIAILEFKKHTLKTPIKDQKISNYYPKSDRKKYDRLLL